MIGNGWHTWPGRDRREPAPSTAGFLHLFELMRSLRAAVRMRLGSQRGLRVLDIACARKPYYPLFAEHARQYVGLDLNPRPGSPECLGAAEALPFHSATFDVAICTQAFSYFENPWTVIEEIARVLAPGGLLLLSTPGLYPYAEDRWRFTHTGLEALLADRGFESIQALRQGGAVMCLAQLGALCLGAAAEIAPAGPVRGLVRGLTLGTNLLGLGIDRALRARGATFCTTNYLVLAVRGPKTGSR